MRTRARAFAAAGRLPGYADSWIDDRGDPSQDPLQVVVNVRVTRDLAQAERTLRMVWGGPLCVSEAERTQAELLKVQSQLMKVPGVLTSVPHRGRVDLYVVFDDGTLQQEMDKTYGRAWSSSLRRCSRIPGDVGLAQLS